MRLLIELFLTFAKIGLFTFGGGYAMISVIESICVEQKEWLTHDEMMNITVIAESTPGPIAINCSTFTGYKQGGLPGALAATAGMVLPSFVIIYVISMFLDGFLEIPFIANAFRGIKLAVGLLILDAGRSMMKKMPKNRMSRLILGTACTAMLLINAFSWTVSSVSLMLIGGAVSLVVCLVSGKRQKGGEG